MPTLPPEVPYTEAEQRFMTNEPPGLWPENQDSVFGQLRRVLTDEIQANRDKTNVLGQEMFVRTAQTYLNLWEEMLGAIISPAGKTVAQRRAVLLARLKYGAFTRTKRAEIVAEYVRATFGQPAAFTLLGIPFGSGGIKLFGPLSDPYSLFRVYEDAANFAYEVRIKNTNTVDTSALTRDLQRITPAGINFTIDNSVANVLDYAKMIKTHAPSGWWKLGSNFTDSSGNGYTLTAFGGVTPSSGAALVQNNGADVSTNFDGADDVLKQSPVAVPLKPRHSMTMEVWINADTLAANTYPMRRQAAYEIEAASAARAMFNIGGSSFDVTAPAGTLTTGANYHIVATYDGAWIRLYVNGVEVGSDYVLDGLSGVDNTINDPGTDLTIGSFFDGRIDEAAIYGYALSPARVLEHYRTGINLP